MNTGMAQKRTVPMRIRAGFEITFDCPKPTPMLLLTSVHPSRQNDLMTPHEIRFEPHILAEEFHDSFGNVCRRIVSPSGLLTIATDFLIRDSGDPDPVDIAARQHAVQDLPNEVLPYLFGSRYCETDRLSDVAWSLFASAPEGWTRVQAICDHVHRHIAFGYAHARPTKSAWDAYNEKQGVCRDFAHLAITFCRCMNIPARYCTGYLGDIGIPPVDEPMDFSAWMEVFLGGAWHTFDARHNKPRIGRILMARGRDAADVAISTSFGHCTLQRFRVFTDEVK